MTTIAYKDGIIATDSQLTAGDFILTQDCVKRRVHNGRSFWLSGSEIDINEFIPAWPNGAIHEDSNVVGFVLDESGTLYVACSDDGRCATWKQGGYPWAYGSGAHFAIGAMDAGMSASEAVAIAAGRDTGTGGEIRTYCASTGNNIKKPQGHE